MRVKASTLRVLAMCGIVSAALYTAAYVIGALLRDGYSTVGDSVSELIEKGAPNKLGLDLLIGGYHLLLIPFAVGIYLASNRGRAAFLGAAMFVLAGGIGLVAVSSLSCDPGCDVPTTFTGRMHIVTAIVMGFLDILAVLAFSRAFKGDERWQGFHQYSFWTFVLGIAAAALTVAAAKGSFVGLAERFTVGLVQAWSVVIGITIIRRAEHLSAPRIERGGAG